jgi:hemolysin activation/secretion protein
VREQFAANQLIGRPVPLDRLLALTQLINLAFVRNGYVNSGVLLAGPPPVDGGVLVVRPVYGRAAAASDGSAGPRVRFAERGRGGLSERYVRARLAAAEAVPFNAVRLEEEFRRLAQDPAVRTVGADLTPGAAAGEAELDVVVDPAERYDVYADVANSRSPSIGGERYAVGGSFRNLLVAGDLVSAEAGVTGGRGDGTLGYQAPLASPSTLLTLRGGYDRAAVVDPILRPLGIRSTDWFVEGGLGWRAFDIPLAPAAEGGRLRDARSLTLGLRLAHREQRTWLLGQRFSFSPGSVDGLSRYTAARLTADFVQRGVTQVLAVSAVGSQGLGGTHFEAAGRLDPAGDFRVLLVQASYARRLDDRLELRLRGAAQWASGPLYTGERFSLGGENTVRGYRENLLLSDGGAFASVELARAFSLDGARRGPGRPSWGSFSLSVFADAGVARNRRAPDPKPLASIGASVTWTPSDAVFARLTYGKALRHAGIEGHRDLQDRGIGFRVTVRPIALFSRDL